MRTWICLFLDLDSEFDLDFNFRSRGLAPFLLNYRMNMGTKPSRGTHSSISKMNTRMKYLLLCYVFGTKI